MMQSIRAKVMAIFVAFSLLVLLLAVLSGVRADREAERLDAILANNAAIQTAAMEALSEARRGEYYLDKALLLTDPRERDTLRLYYSQLQHTTSNFDIFIKVLTWGSDSEAFKVADAGLTYQQWVRRGWHEKLVIRNVPDEIRQLAGVADMYYAGMSKYASTAINALRKALRLESAGRTGTAETVRARGMADVRQAQYYGELVNETLKQLIGATERSARAMRAEIQQVQRSNRLITGAIGLVLLLGFTGAGWFYLNRILVQPLRKLTSEVHEIGRGAFSRKVGVNSQNEIGWLAVSFNEMTEEIQRTTVSKAYVDNIIQSMTDTLVVVNRDGTIGEANHALLNLLGYEERELLGKHELLGAPFHKVLGDVSVEHKIIDALKNSGFISGMETTYLAKDGSEIPVSLSSSVMRDHDGHDTGFVCVAQDITERKRAEEALHRYKGIVSASSDLMAFIGSDYVYQAVNTAYVEAFDKTIEQVVGRHMADFIGKKTFETTVRPHLDQCLSGKAAHYQHWLELPALGRRYLDVRYDPSHDADGSVSGVAMNVRDITEREKTERRRVMEHAVTRLLAEADTLAHVMPRIIQTICETLGLVCGAHWRWHEQDQVLRHAETWSVPAAELTEFLTCQSTNDVEKSGEGLIRRSWASGKYTWISDVSQESNFWRAPFAKKAGLRGAFAFPIRVGRKTYGIMEFFSHDSHKPDEALLQSADAIGSQIGQFCQRKQAEAEREALHRRLVDASRQAGKAEIATGVLHNVGNVLNSVNVSATLVADKIRESRVANLTKASQLLHAHADDLARFMTEDKKGKQLPAYLVTLAAHLESERQTMLSEFESITDNINHIKQIVIRQQSYASDAGVTESTVIADLLDDALSMNVSERHEINIIREYDAVPVFTVDKHKLLQIIVNLIRNAKQAINEYRADGKRIMLRIKRVGSGRVRVEVTDNGVGISEDNITRLFEYGFTTKDEGHGFGLHVSANTAKELGGSLACHSEGPGKGATFTLEFPFAVTEQAA